MDNYNNHFIIVCIPLSHAIACLQGIPISFLLLPTCIFITNSSPTISNRLHIYATAATLSTEAPPILSVRASIPTDSTAYLSLQSFQKVFLITLPWRGELNSSQMLQMMPIDANFAQNKAHVSYACRYHCTAKKWSCCVVILMMRVLGKAISLLTFILAILQMLIFIK